jgi:hypothetical protein
MGAKTDDFLNYVSDVNKNFLKVKEIKEIKITHRWVNGFGWENTILIESDFKYLEKLPTNKQGENIALALEKQGFNYLIIKYEES